MNNIRLKLVVWVVALAAVCSAFAGVPAIEPIDRLDREWWKVRHEKRVAAAATGEYDVVFIGDSITQGWEGAGKAMWDRYYGHRKALNVGFNADQIEHALWHLENGAFPQRPPRLVILLLGTNNTGFRKKDTPEQTAEGLRVLLQKIHVHAPEAKVLLLAIFPREARPDGKLRQINDQLNTILPTLADGDRVQFLNINEKLLEPDGTLSRAIMPDLLHPNEKGYQIWAEAMEPTVAKILGDTPVR